MSMSEQNISKPNKPLNEQEGASPLPGCIIIITVVVVFGGLAMLYIGFAFWMNNKLDAFTSPEATEISVINPSQQQLDTVYEKLKQLEQATKESRMVRVSFSAEDINTLIANDPLLASLRGNTKVESIDSQGIQTQVSQQFRGLPFRPSRFLNATFAFVPVVLKDSVVFEIHDIRVSGKEVPQGFIEGYSKQDFFKLDTNNENLKPVLIQLRRTYLEKDRIVVETGRDSNER